MEIPPRLNIIKEREFDEQLLVLVGNMEEADEFIAAAEELLARDPRNGLLVNEEIWYLPMSPIRGRRVSIFYTFDEHAVTFLFIVAFDD